MTSERPAAPAPPPAASWKWGIEGYGDPAADELHASRDAALADLLESLPARDWPATVEAEAYAPVRVRRNEIEALNPLAFILEMLDAKYADPELLGGSDPTPHMEQAEKAFIEAILENYVPWYHERVHGETVSVKRWLRKRPDIRPAPEEEDLPWANGRGGLPASAQELRERLITALPPTLEMLSGFETLTARQKTACLREAVAEAAEKIDKALAGRTAAPALEDLPAYSEMVVSLGKALIRRHKEGGP